MKTEQQVEAMLRRFDTAGDDLDADTEAVRDTLLWFLGHRDDEQLAAYLPDDE
jgi:hypothetical protein